MHINLFGPKYKRKLNLTKVDVFDQQRFMYINFCWYNFLKYLGPEGVVINNDVFKKLRAYPLVE
jgi:hypothetical protein